MLMRIKIFQNFDDLVEQKSPQCSESVEIFKAVVSRFVLSSAKFHQIDGIETTFYAFKLK